MATTFYTFVELMSGVPLDPQYKHTLTFNSSIEQTNYFTSKVTHNSNNFSFLSYQRYQSGVIKVEASMNLLGNVNYLRFSNSNFSGEGQLHEAKYFYAFIRDITYISDRVVSITYQVDVLQTWMFDYTVNPCYIEREHANSDNVGDNRVTEGLDTGPYIEAGWEPLDFWDSSRMLDSAHIVQNSNFVVIATQGPNGEQTTFQYNGIVGTLYIRNLFSVTELDDLMQEYYNGATRSLEPIISINMYPSYYQDRPGLPMTGKTWRLTKDQTIGFGGFFGYDPATTSTKHYIPKNNKLYCYPYNYMVFESPEGASNILKFEDFRNNNYHNFYSRCSIYPSVETMCAPFDYENVNDDSRYGDLYNLNTKYALYSKSYPVCGVASDAYSAWWAQNRSYYPLGSAYVEAGDAIAASVAAKPERPNTFLGGLQTAWDAVTALADGVKQYFRTIQEPSNVLQNAGTGFRRAGSSLGDKNMKDTTQRGLGTIGSDASEIGQTLAAVQSHKAVPDTLVTKAGNTGILHTLELDCYKIRYTKIRPEYAEIIDNYFTCFGYATHVVKTPNIFGRRSWNYVQTVGCTISGNVPAEAESQITDIFNRGVTFWHNPATIHNYNADNSIV